MLQVSAHAQCIYTCMIIDALHCENVRVHWLSSAYLLACTPSKKARRYCNSATSEKRAYKLFHEVRQRDRGKPWRILVYSFPVRSISEKCGLSFRNDFIPPYSNFDVPVFRCFDTSVKFCQDLLTKGASAKYAYVSRMRPSGWIC